MWMPCMQQQTPTRVARRRAEAEAGCQRGRALRPAWIGMELSQAALLVSRQHDLDVELVIEV